MNISPEFEQYIESQGWIIECQSPLEIRHEDGSFATLYAAKLALAQLEQEYKDNLDTTLETNRSYEKDSIEEQQGKILELIKLNNIVQDYIQKAQEAERLDNERNNGYPGTAWQLWETTYDLVFSPSISRRVFSLFEDLNMRLDYYDPDTSYQEDVVAFAEAFKEKIEPFEVLLQKPTSHSYKN